MRLLRSSILSGDLVEIGNAKSSRLQNIKALAIDEADRILEVGFEDEMRQSRETYTNPKNSLLTIILVVKILPKDERQTMLFSGNLYLLSILAEASLLNGFSYANHEGPRPCQGVSPPGTSVY